MTDDTQALLPVLPAITPTWGGGEKVYNEALPVVSSVGLPP